VGRLRRFVAFDALLARLFATDDPPWILKGGYTLELRLAQAARPTKDLDLSVPSLHTIPLLASPDQAVRIAALLAHLRQESARNLEDCFVFRVGEPMTELDAPPYGGARFPVESHMDNRLFVAFHVDVGLGDALVAPPEWLTGQSLLAFAGIPAGRFAVLPRAQQFAEKIHAYTQPRERLNTRVKDLIDLVLLIEIGLPPPEEVAHALRATFNRRESHPLPTTLDAPPEQWRTSYATLAAECGLPYATPGEALQVVIAYWQTLAPD